MRILLLLPFHSASADAALNPDTGLPLDQIHNSWYRALKQLNHEVRVFIYSSFTAQFDYYLLFLQRNLGIPIPLQKLLPLFIRQQKLLTLATKFRPEVILFSGNSDLIFSNTLTTLQRQHHAKLVLLNGIAPVLFATHTERSLAPEFDGIFCNDAIHAIDWEILGAHNSHALPVSAIDPLIHKKYPLAREERNLAAEVAFVGSLEPYALYRDRIALLEQIAHLNLKIWTPHKELIMSNHKLRHCYMGTARGEKMYKIFSNSKISINIHGHTMPKGGNMRTFEISGCGGFQLIDHTSSTWYANGKEVVRYKDSHDLIKKITYYLSHSAKRNAIAAQGFIRSHREHTYKQRFKKLLQLI